MRGHHRNGINGFTLIELIAVIMLLSLTFVVVIPNVENLSPAYSLRGAARTVGSAIEQARGESVAKRRSFSLAYDFDERAVWLVLPPGHGAEEFEAGDPDDELGGGGASTGSFEPDEPLEGRETIEPDYLPRGIRFRRVLLPGNEERTSGTVYVTFSPLGSDGSHIVQLVNENDDVISVEFHALAATLHYENDERRFEEFQGQEEGGF